MTKELSVLILICLSIITQQIVSWAGGMLHSVETFSIPYANFTFESDRNTPMTTNILMNVFIPNVAMVFIHVFAQKYNCEYIEKYLLYFVISFFVWRMVLICILLRRKEMYNWIYELCIAAVAICIGFLLKKYFLTTETNILMTVSELREELWFVIIIVLYKFIKHILDYKITQNTVLNKTRVKQYIIRKFKKFYGKFNGLMEINKINRNMCVFIFATMIYEDYNRGPIIRKVERIKLVLTGSATLGIMQVDTNENISDEDSIIKFYAWLESLIIERNLAYDGEWVRELAWEHNNDLKYAEEIENIFRILIEYLEEVPRFRNIFHMREELTNNERYAFLQELTKDYQQGLISKEKYQRKKRRYLKKVKGCEQI